MVFYPCQPPARAGHAPDVSSIAALLYYTPEQDRTERGAMVSLHRPDSRTVVLFMTYSVLGIHPSP